MIPEMVLARRWALNRHQNIRWRFWYRLSQQIMENPQAGRWLRVIYFEDGPG
jgi:hypothetical protein